MARSQHSWGLKFFLASIVLLFCLAVTTVEGRSTPFISLLTPEHTGHSTSDNKKSVGQAFAYLSKSGENAFHLEVLTVVDVDPKTITKVQLYNTVDKKLVGDKFTLIEQGYFVYNNRISYDLGESINVQDISVNVYTKAVGTKRPAISGTLVNNRTSFISFLQDDQNVATASGTSKNVGFASAVAWSTDSINYFLSVVVNHDVDQKVTAIQLNGPAASNTVGQLIFEIPLLDHSSKAINVPINSTVLYWLSNHLGYLNIITTKNTAGAIRGQLIPTTTPRTRTFYVPNKATVTIGGQDFSPLADGGSIIGNIGFSLQQGGARNLTGNTTDPRVALFAYNGTTFNNYFEFKLPVTIKNKFVIRSAVFYITAAADVVDNLKFNIGLYDFSTAAVVNFIQVPGAGLRDFSTYQINIDSGAFPEYLSPKGLYVNVNAASLAGNGLYVDRFFMNYYVVNAYANNILKSIFYKGSEAN